MSVVINSNAAATVAANNLAASNTALQKSLNRLSSGSKIVNPADDAGGLAVSMKLSAAARRQGAVETNIANATSLLQTQDGVLSVTAKILNRISELKVLNADVTKSSSDKANYNSEFKALQAQITANGSEKFNGVALFGSSDLSVGVTEDGKTSVTAKAVALLGSSTPPVTKLEDNFADLTNWDDSYNGGTGTTTASGGTLKLATPAFGDVAWPMSKTAFTGPFELSFGFKVAAGGSSALNVTSGGSNVGFLVNDTAQHTLRVTVDATGTQKAYLDGSETPFNQHTGIDVSSPQKIIFSMNVPGSEIDISNFKLTDLPSSTPTNVGTVAGATDLSSLSLSTITSAIEDAATYRAQNGATQSRLGFASELVTVNKANLEAANSRITDVDVAQESTALARNNVLVSAGTSMLAQANQSSQMALKLLG